MSPETIEEALVQSPAEARTAAPLPLRVEDELVRVAEVFLGENRASIAAALFGWDGKGPRGLAEVAAAFGRSRERVRQIRTRICEILSGKQGFFPRFCAALSLAESSAPAPASAVSARPTAAGLVRPGFDVAALAATAEAFGLALETELVDIHGVRCLARPESAPLLRAILRAAELRVASHGAATIDLVTQLAAARTGMPVARETAESFLAEYPGYRALGVPGWFRVPVRESRFDNRIRKILSVAPEVPLIEAYRALRRARESRDMLLPFEVFVALCRTLSECVVVGDRLRALLPIDALSPIERTMVDVMRASGGAMLVDDFEAACLARGISQYTFRMYLSSPAFIPLERGVHHLVGAAVPPGLGRALAQRAARGRALLGEGWTEDGRAWSAHLVTEKTVLNGVISIPAPFRDLIRGSFALRLSGGTEIGTVRIEKTSFSGLRKMFRRIGFSGGERIAFFYDARRREIVAETDPARVSKLLD